jgi:hypothetical protein
MATITKTTTTTEKTTTTRLDQSALLNYFTGHTGQDARDLACAIVEADSVEIEKEGISFDEGAVLVVTCKKTTTTKDE